MSITFRKILVVIVMLFLIILLSCLFYGMTVNGAMAFMFSACVLCAIKNMVGIRWSWEK